MRQTAKDWKPISEQLDLIQSRGMVVDDVDHAAHFLKRVGYYRLSGYWYPFRQFDERHERTDKFLDGSRFEEVVALYQFDRDLRLIALDALERIELAIQVEIAHLLGERDKFAHENADELHGHFVRKNGRTGESNHDRWLEGYDSLVQRSRRKPFVDHNMRTYGKLPIWVAIEVFDFGTLSKLYAGMKINDKITIEKQFGLNEGKHLQTWLRGLNFIRNTAAHQSRLWNCNVLELANVPRSKPQLFHLRSSRVFLYFCIMQTIMRVVCPGSNWGNRFTDLMDRFPAPDNQAIKISDMGTTEGWEKWRIWK